MSCQAPCRGLELSADDFSENAVSQHRCSFKKQGGGFASVSKIAADRTDFPHLITVMHCPKSAPRDSVET
ncbi:hypothetical protein BaRGS_00025068, partial [Batillaria attramentaria]